MTDYELCFYCGGFGTTILLYRGDDGFEPKVKLCECCRGRGICNNKLYAEFYTKENTRVIDITMAALNYRNKK